MKSRIRTTVGAFAVMATALGASVPALSYESADGTLRVHGFVENATYLRRGVGLSKARNTAQFEIDKDFETGDFFSALSFHTILRGTYDAVYDLNDKDYGKNAGGPVMIESVGIGGSVPHGGGILLPAGGFDLATNPNDGMIVLGQPLHDPNGGVSFGVPVRPCNIDSRGCLKGYMDDDLDNLRFPEFNSRLDFIREAYMDASIPFGSGEELGIRLGKQQVVWGRTDLFRVLDVINPVDFSRHNIYDELEDTRIPQWMLNLEYRMGGTQTFDDLNFSVVWNFDKFRPANLGQAGTPYQILDAASFFRGMKNCWDNGCTVSNFAGGVLATDFPAGVIGIRQANLPKWKLSNTQIGAKIEGVYDGIGFSLNYLNYISQLPSLHGGSAGPAALNPFCGLPGADCDALPRPYLIAFDIEFPRINLFGGSVDFYMDSIKSVFRVEVAYTTGEEFANSLRPELYSESDVLRYVIGWDRDTFIPFLNKKKAFLLSAQLFGQHILEHELEESLLQQVGAPVTATKVGIPDWKDNWIATFLIKGWWQQNTLSPQIITAYDFRGKAAAVAPSVDWLINDNWRLLVGANFKFGKGARNFDDCRTCNPFPPFTGAGLPGDPTQPFSRGLAGYEPLGRFRSGPIGSALKEDEIQVSLRYRF
jgi:hypothetical protein